MKFCCQGGKCPFGVVNGVYNTGNKQFLIDYTTEAEMTAPSPLMLTVAGLVQRGDMCDVIGSCPQPAMRLQLNVDFSGLPVPISEFKFEHYSDASATQAFTCIIAKP
eukprot:GABV01013751.1.p1 GENE.GABV01013751.1~~GABV01013751.1.p1  ORF type:complete len:107 (-),score=42.37 GABV01013751.1:39-359(-)